MTNQHGGARPKVRKDDRRGGRRPGIGKPPLAQGDPTVRRNISIPGSYMAYLEEIGDGNVSAAIRLLVEQAQADDTPESAIIADSGGKVESR